MSAHERREWLDERTEVLRISSDREELAVAAEELAAADDPDALERLGEFLSDRAFLERLDDLSTPGQKILHLSNVLRPFIERPSPEVAALCLRLGDNDAFRAEDERMAFLLAALANVRPMNAATVEFFRSANDEGYFASNSPLLVANGSPLALKLFVSMMSDRDVDWERRIDCLHWSIVPQRTRGSTLEVAADLLAMDLEEAVAHGVLESVFDFHWQWFGSRPPEPPAWRSADTAVLARLAELGESIHRHDLPASLQESIEGTVEIARALLSRRQSG